MGSPSTPKVQDPAKSYLKGIQANIRYAPQIADAEYRLRAQYDNQSVENNLTQQQSFGGQFIDEYRSQLAQNDPWGTAGNAQIGQQVTTDLAKGYTLDASTTRDAQQGARVAEVASGNYLGNAAVSKEATVVGKASFAAINQRVQGAQSFLNANNALKMVTTMHLLETGATSPDRGTNYVSSTAGFNAQNLANQTYQADLQFAQSYNPNEYLNSWQRMAQGAYIGARQGWQYGSLLNYFFPAAGAYASIGGALGGSFQGLINAPDYQWNVQNSGYAIYGVPWQSTAISAGTAVGSSWAGSAAGAYGSFASFAASTAVNAAGTYGQTHYSGGH